MRLKRLSLIIFNTVLFADQLSKILVKHALVPGIGKTLIPWVNLSLVHNQGAAFSMLSSAGGWQRWFLTALAAIVSIFIVLWIRKLPEHEKLTGIALSLVLGGAVGNLVDRVIYGHVIDFIDFYYPGNSSCLPFFNKLSVSGCHFATFNIADSAITIGAVLMILASLFPGLHKKPD